MGSARDDGNTAKVAAQLATKLDCDLIDLLQERISPYRYDADYTPDDTFIELLRQRVLPHQLIVFASPVYWYTMSGHLKLFLDRFTDLLTSHKDLGRQLRGKELAVLSCANDGEVNDSFYDAFRRTAGYLGMEYSREWHGFVEGDGVVLTKRPYPTPPRISSGDI